MQIMERTEIILNDLCKAFSFLEGHANIQRQRRIFAEIPDEKRASIKEILRYLRDNMKFTFLCTITGLDIGDNFQVIYHLADDGGILINLKILTPRSKPVIESVTSVFEGAVFYERELKDLLGIEVNGLPPGRRYPLPDGWPEGQYPLRKDWHQAEEEGAEKKS